MKYILTSRADILNAIFDIQDMLDKEGPLELTLQTTTPSRTVQQNRLAFLWYKHLSQARQDETPEFYRALCKLEIGVPILREDDSFREKYDSKVRPYPYHKKLEFMNEPFDFPVTRIMTVKEFTRYLENMERRWAEHGTVLPRPEDVYYAAMGIKRNV